MYAILQNRIFNGFSTEDSEGNLIAVMEGTIVSAKRVNKHLIANVTLSNGRSAYALCKAERAYLGKAVVHIDIQNYLQYGDTAWVVGLPTNEPSPFK